VRVLGAFLAAVLLTACGGGYGTPAETLETLKAAAASGDSATLYASLDAEARAFHRDMMRIWKARLERGDEVALFAHELPLEPKEIRALSEEEAAIKWVGQDSPIVRSKDWFETARVVGEPRVRSEDERALTLRGRDGAEREVWFVREDGRWKFDILQTEWAHR